MRRKITVPENNPVQEKRFTAEPAVEPLSRKDANLLVRFGSVTTANSVLRISKKLGEAGHPSAVPFMLDMAAKEEDSLNARMIMVDAAKIMQMHPEIDWMSVMRSQITVMGRGEEKVKGLVEILYEEGVFASRSIPKVYDGGAADRKNLALLAAPAVLWLADQIRDKREESSTYDAAAELFSSVAVEIIARLMREIEKEHNGVEVMLEMAAQTMPRELAEFLVRQLNGPLGDRLLEISKGNEWVVNALTDALNECGRGMQDAAD